MRRLTRVEDLLDKAESERRCAYGSDDNERRALRRRSDAGLLVSPYRNVYARTGYWKGLDPIERTRHVARALARLHPRWVFAGTTAACFLGYDHGYGLHRDGSIVIASTTTNDSHDHRRLRRIPMADVPTVHVGGVAVTDPVRTLVDCATTCTFEQALPLFDSAARHGVDVRACLRMCVSLRMDSSGVRMLCHYTDPNSENGGESLGRAVIITLGFAVPLVQYEFANPDNPAAPYRVDFAWFLPDGRIIVAEYDGMHKYTLAERPDRRTIQATVQAERRREDHLRAQGVSAIIRFDYDDVMHPERLARKLVGVPRREQR